ncbi:MAG TPA: methyltransferase [Candidatus Acidoferrum sp.]|jgi:ubiquinone/menaquinone biosynthesis C-methylase UbiE
MATPSQTGKPSPERIFSTLISYQQSEALKAAINLDLFTKIGEGAEDAAALAKAVGASERGTRILADYMTIQGFLAKEGTHYKLTPESAIFLDKRSPAYMGAMAGFLGAPHHKATFANLTEIVRKGSTIAVEGSNLEPHDEFWVAFAQSMGGLATPSAQFIAGLIGSSEGKPVKVLDIAAGHGMFGLVIARMNPNAQIVALDWPNVLAVAEENAKNFGVADRWSKKEGSAFEANYIGADGEGYDYILLTNILHHFDHAGNVTLMKRVYAALKPGGKAITLEFVPNADRVSPPVPAAFSMVMLANTDSGDAYTFKELDKIFTEAGFSKTVAHPIAEMPQTVLVSDK